MPKPLALALVLCCTVLASSPLAAQDVDPAFRADIEKLLAVTGAANIAVQMASALSDQVIDGMKQQQPAMPPRVGEIVKEVLRAEYSKFALGPDGLQAKTVAIYARHFTHDEIKALLAFYESEIGKKTLSVMPQLMQEGMAVGQEWTQANMPRIMGVLQERLKAEGLVK